MWSESDASRHMLSSCEEKQRLLLEYERSIEMYSSAVSELARQTGIISQEEYTQLHWDAEVNRQISAAVRSRLERHVAQHGC